MGEVIKCEKCGFGHKTFEEMDACKSWEEMQIAKSECPLFRGKPGGECIECGRIAYEHNRESN